MKFANFIGEAGLDLDAYPKASEIEVAVYESKERLVEKDTYEFEATIFANNPKGLEKFRSFVESLEENLERGTVTYKDLKGMSVRVEGLFSLVIHVFNRPYIFYR